MIRAIFKYKPGFLVSAILIFSGSQLSSQELNKEVYVVRPYEPTLSDANKYNFLPQTDDFETATPKFRYSITPIRIANPFDPDPIKAAKTVTTSLPRIYNTWIKLGMGNYSTPMAEFNISNLRSKEYAYGAYLYHKSSHGNVRLSNDDKVKAGYVVNRMNLYLKRFLKSSTISGNLRFNQDGFNYYGYNTERIAGPLDLDRDSLKQRIFNPGIDAGIQSNMTDNEQLNYNIAASYDYFFDKQKNKESSLLIKSALSKNFNEMLGGVDLSIDYSNLKGMDTLSNTIVRINPWISKRSADWNFKLGFEAVVDAANITNFYFYPRANLDIIIIEDVLVPFIGLTGALQKNSYRNLHNENQFVKPGLSLKNTSSNIIVYGGLKGNINSLLRFRADVSYTVYKNYHFFVNDTITESLLLPLQNQFTGVYDDINLITYHGQLALQPSEKIEMVLDARYVDYKTFEEPKPWHKPNLVIGLDASYKPGQKMEIGAGVSLVGKRWARDYSQPDNMKELDPVIDANFSLNYHYSKLLTVFANLYNLSERSYEIWNQYPSQRFNFMIGFSYKL
ncbi:MAG: hypothetical protein JXA72_13840 [Bacteroidales bacterium]|nr:hypothetical protein [Bacteroidales bacterium]